MIGPGRRRRRAGGGERGRAIMKRFWSRIPAIAVSATRPRHQHQPLGDAASPSGKLDRRSTLTASALAIIEKLVAADRPTISACSATCGPDHDRRVLAITGPRADALATFRRSLAAILEAWPPSDPDNPAVAGGSGVVTTAGLPSCWPPADRARRRLAPISKALTIRVQLAAAEPNNTERQRDVFHSFYRDRRSPGRCWGSARRRSDLPQRARDHRAACRQRSRQRAMATATCRRRTTMSATCCCSPAAARQALARIFARRWRSASGSLAINPGQHRMAVRTWR